MYVCIFSFGFVRLHLYHTCVTLIVPIIRPD